MSEALPLPPRPNIEQYKKLAKDLQTLQSSLSRRVAAMRNPRCRYAIGPRAERV